MFNNHKINNSRYVKNARDAHIAFGANPALRNIRANIPIHVANIRVASNGNTRVKLDSHQRRRERFPAVRRVYFRGV